MSTPRQLHLSVNVPPGRTAQCFSAAPNVWRVMDVRVETPGVVASRVMSGTNDVTLPEGAAWEEVLGVQELRAAKDQHVIVVVKNTTEAPVTARLTVFVEESTETQASGTKQGAQIKSKTELENVSEHGETVTFLMGRGVLPYAASFVRGGGGLPKQMHAVGLEYLESSRFVRTSASKPLSSGSSEVEVTLGANLRREVARALRTKTMLRLSAEDRAHVAAALSPAPVQIATSAPAAGKIARLAVASGASHVIVPQGESFSIVRGAGAGGGGVVGREITDADRLEAVREKLRETTKELSVVQAERAELKTRVAALESMVEMMRDEARSQSPVAPESFSSDGASS